MYQQIEFEIIKSEPKSIATNITAFHNTPLSTESHQNLQIPRSEKKKRLLDEPDALNVRHSGVVFQVSENEQEGFIMPDKLYCTALHFHKNAIQSTGIQHLPRWAEVEFDVKPKRKSHEYDQAVCV